ALTISAKSGRASQTSFLPCASVVLYARAPRDSAEVAAFARGAPWGNGRFNSFDERRGYVGTHPELRSPVTALSLGGLRRRIEIALLPKVDVDIQLELDRGTRLERDRRRLQGRPRRPHA